jgi:hypothetical protein
MTRLFQNKEKHHPQQQLENKRNSFYKTKSNSMYVEHLDKLMLGKSHPVNNNQPPVINESHSLNSKHQSISTKKDVKSVKLKKLKKSSLRSKAVQTDQNEDASDNVGDLFHIGSMNNLKLRLNNAKAILKNSLSLFNLKSSSSMANISTAQANNASSNFSMNNTTLSSASFVSSSNTNDTFSENNAAPQQMGSFSTRSNQQLLAIPDHQNPVASQSSMNATSSSCSSSSNTNNSKSNLDDIKEAHEVITNQLLAESIMHLSNLNQSNQANNSSRASDLAYGLKDTNR